MQQIKSSNTKANPGQIKRKLLIKRGKNLLIKVKTYN